MLMPAGRRGRPTPHTVVVPSPILLVPVLVLVLFATLLYRRLVRAPGYQSVWLRVGAIAVLAGLGIAVFVGFAYQSAALDDRGARLIGMIGMTWLATAFYLLLGTLVGALVALGLRLTRRRDLIGPWHRRSVPVIVTVSLLVTGYGFVEARQLRVTAQTVTVPSLPAGLEGYRLAVISDLHAGPIRGADLVARVVDLTNRADPDVVLLVGDLTDGTTAQFGPVLRPLSGLDSADGVLAVTGNHEYYAGDAAGWVELWRELGITPLLNESLTIEHAGATLRLAGVSDAAGSDAGIDAPAPGLRPDLRAALKDVTAQEPTVLLAHQPGVGTDPAVRSAGVDLMVSGHTHGGQIWPFTLLVGLANPTVVGLDEVEGTTAYTTRGAGTWGPPVRFLVPPEIAVLTLTAGD